MDDKKDDKFEESFDFDLDSDSSADKAKFGRVAKKLLAAGIGAAFLTEESIRTYVNDLRLPKDVMKMLLQGAQKSKDDLTNRVSKEVIAMMSKIDWTKEASRFLEKHKFRASVEFEILPKDKEEKGS